MRRSLKSSFEVHYERVVYRLQDFLFRLNMLYLFKSDDLALLQTLKSQGFCLGGLASVLNQSHSTECASTQSGQEFEIVE